MTEAISGVLVFLKLAEISHARQQANQRDKFLMLAGHAAWMAEKENWCATVHRIVLATHPHHLLKHFRTWEQAEQDAEFQAYFRQLQKFCSRERGELFLHQWHNSIDTTADIETLESNCQHVLDRLSDSVVPDQPS